jgi:putative MFS transporter
MAELTATSDGATGTSSRLFSLAVVVAALGYLVDIYDLILFSVIRVPSLTAIGVHADQTREIGAHILSMQMFGMLLGGILWGVLGDRRGRMSVLFASIILYSLANIANGFVHTVGQYGWVRVVAGIGLAGELGAGITLVSESIDKKWRGYATTIVAGVGVCGALIAVGVSRLVDWRTAYFIGGGLGLALLALRVGVLESGMFKRTALQSVTRGNFFALLTNPRRLRRYLSVILTGVPIWFFIGILLTFSSDLGTALKMSPAPTNANAVFWGYFGLALGDFGAGWLSQKLGSRKRTLRIFIAGVAVTVPLMFVFGTRSTTWFYAFCVITGFAAGYWAVFVTVAAEQFGTNLRATATTTVPNFVRGLVPVLAFSFNSLARPFSLPTSALIVGAVTIVIAFVATFGLEETFGKDLDYVED